MYIIIISTNNDSFISFFNFLKTLFLFLIYRHFRIMLIRSSVAGHSYIIPYLRGKTFNIVLVSTAFAIVF